MIHAINQIKIPEDYTQVSWFFRRLIFSGGIPVFFFLSGYLWASGKKLAWTTQLKKDAIGLLYPFITLSILFETINIARGAYHWDHIQIASKSILLFQSDMQNLPSGVLWFLFSLFTFRQIANTIRDSRYFTIISIAIFAFGSTLNFITYPTPFLGADKLHFYLFFFLGSQLKISNQIFQISPRKTLLIAISLAALLSTAAAIFHKEFVEKLLVNFNFINVFGALAAVKICQSFGFANTAKIEHFGKHSMIPYVTHMPIFALAGTALPGVIKRTPYTHAIVLWFTAIFGGIVLIYAASKFPKLYAVFFGKPMKN